MLAIVTDGLTEVTASDGEEIGFRGISQALQASECHSLRDIAANIFAAANHPHKERRSKPVDDPPARGATDALTLARSVEAG